ncbi:MAG TPA: type II toxin-antitoxin system HicB family antitoxin [Rhizomicrobium sp.]
MRYIALIDGKAGAYGASFPDLPGCTVMGKTIDAAMNNAAEALRDWVEVAEESGVRIPAPCAAETVRRDGGVKQALAAGAQLASVPLVRETGKPVKANLSLDSGVLAALDHEADRRSLTRSALIELMAREMLVKM